MLQIIKEMPRLPNRPVRPLDGVLPRPFSSSSLVSLAVGLVHMSDLRHERVVRVRVSQHRADREQDYIVISKETQMRHG